MSAVIDNTNDADIFASNKKFKDYYNYLCNFSKKSQFNTFDYLKTKDSLKLNYLQQHLDFDIFNIKLDLSIDFAKIFYPISSFNKASARNVIQQSFINVHPVNNSKNMLKGNVDINGVRHQVIFVYVDINGFYKGLSVRLIHPNRDLINYIESYFGIGYRLTAVEYSMDLRSNNNMQLLKIIACTMVQKYSRVSVGKIYNTTYYCSNPRRAATLGSYVYHKTIQNDDFVRIECRYKTPYFKKKKITSILGACTINPIDVFGNIDFKLFNVKRFLKKYLRIMSVVDGNDTSKAKTFEEYFFENFSERQGGGILSVAKMLQQMVSNRHVYFDTYPLGSYLNTLITNKSFV